MEEINQKTGGITAKASLLFLTNLLEMRPSAKHAHNSGATWGTMQSKQKRIDYRLFLTNVGLFILSGLSIVIIVTIAVALGVFILLVGLLILKR